MIRYTKKGPAKMKAINIELVLGPNGSVTAVSEERLRITKGEAYNQITYNSGLDASEIRQDFKERFGDFPTYDEKDFQEWLRKRGRELTS